MNWDYLSEFYGEPLQPQLDALAKQITQQWIDTFCVTGEWVMYGTPHETEQEAKQMAGRLLVFKKGVQVKKFGKSKSYVVLVWDPV